MNVTRRAIAVGLCAACMSLAASITLSPAGGNIQGSPGETIGWGFQFTNDTPDFALLTFSDFTPPVNGSYTDFLTFNLVVVGPSTTSAVQPFVLPGSGLGAFSIRSNAPPGPINGTIIVGYDLYSMNPNDPSFDPNSAVSFGNTVSTAASVLVVSPEPIPSVLSISGIGLLLAFRCIRRAVMRPAGPRT